jgi:uridylate kinase
MGTKRRTGFDAWRIACTMKHQFGRTVVVALGGSIVHPDGIDVPFLKKFDRFVRREVRRKRRFILVVGGGKLSRRFQDAASGVHHVADEDKDWLGIHATRLNAHLVRTIFRDIADPVVLDSREKVKRLRYSVTIASGWRPGWSTDYIAAVLAADFHTREFVVAGKPAYVFDKDNAKHKNAKPFHELSWRAYRKLIPKKWRPGLHAPVDPVAAALAEKRGIAAAIINGRDLKNFANLLRGSEFVGTMIR